jgi:hypothetical protein
MSAWIGGRESAIVAMPRRWSQIAEQTRMGRQPQHPVWRRAQRDLICRGRRYRPLTCKLWENKYSRGSSRARLPHSARVDQFTDRNQFPDSRSDVIMTAAPRGREFICDQPSICLLTRKTENVRVDLSLQRKDAQMSGFASVGEAPSSLHERKNASCLTFASVAKVSRFGRDNSCPARAG